MISPVNSSYTKSACDCLHAKKLEAKVEVLEDRIRVLLSENESLRDQIREARWRLDEVKAALWMQDFPE